MATANPYQPPRADVADIRRVTDEVQEVNVWSASGRIGRLRYSAYLVLGYIALFLVSMVAGFVGAATRSPTFTSVLLGIITIVFLVWSILKAIQRSHDMGWSGWMVLLSLIPFVAFIWFLKSGTQGSNEYGAPPPPTPLALQILGWLMPVAVVGLLAAVALPAYQTYVMKAKAMQAQRLPQPPSQQPTQ